MFGDKKCAESHEKNTVADGNTTVILLKYKELCDS